MFFACNNQPLWSLPGKSLPCQVALLVAVTFFLATSSFASNVLEYKVKAAFVLNFAKFAKWPVTATPDSSSPYILVVVGNEDVKTAFQIIEGKAIGTHHLQVQFLKSSEAIGDCHMIFISQEVDRARVSEILAAVESKPVLTVGEKNDFLARGGMINFFQKRGKLLFEISMANVRKQKVQLSSRLLNLAVLVDNK